MDNRYQYQPWYIKLWRWIRYMPLAYLTYWYILITWKLKGSKIEEGDWFQTAKSFCYHLKTMCTCYAEMKMKWYYTIEEIIDGN
jgi:hypothetical protein